MNNKLNKYKYPGAKRLMLEAQELKDNTEDYCAQPLDDNLFEWHFTVRGPPDTAFDGGYYHGRLSFPTEYPMKPPSIILLTPNGRFETNKKICLSISGYHPETWQPSWSVRTALLALIAFMPTKGNKAIGSLDCSDPERKKFARESRSWRCETCGLIKDLLVPPSSGQLDLESSPSQSIASTSRVHMESVIDSDSDKRSRSAELGSSTETKTTSVEKNEKEERAEDAGHRRIEPDISSYDNTETKTDDTNVTNLTQTSFDMDSSRVVYETATMSNSVQHRRTYPTYVLKSIFILLSLLILRRVVMIIQS